MKAYILSKENRSININEKLNQMNSYATGDLLYLLREIEKHPNNYDISIINRCCEKLYEKNTICM